MADLCDLGFQRWGASISYLHALSGSTCSLRHSGLELGKPKSKLASVHLLEKNIERLPHHRRLVYVRSAHFGFETLFLVWTYQHIDRAVVPFRSHGFAPFHDVELYIQ